VAQDNRRHTRWACQDFRWIDAVAAPTAADLTEIAHGDYLAEEGERRYPVEAKLAEADQLEHELSANPEGLGPFAAEVERDIASLRARARLAYVTRWRQPPRRRDRRPCPRPAARRPRARRTTSASRDGPSDDDSGESEPPRRRPHADDLAKRLAAPEGSA